MICSVRPDATSPSANTQLGAGRGAPRVTVSPLWPSVPSKVWIWSDQIQTFDGTDGHSGLTVTLGAPRPAPSWVFADGLVASGLTEQIIVYNPSASDVAEADVDVLLDDPNKNGTPE